MLSSVFLAVRLAATTLHLEPLKHSAWWASEWTWSSLGLTLGLTLVYRYAMSSKPVDWRGSLIGGAAASTLSLLASWASALYVEQFANYGATCPLMPSNFTQWKMWQYSSTGTVPGISGSVDMDEFNGSLSQLVAFAGTPPPPPPPPPPHDAGTTPPKDAGVTHDAGGAAHDAGGGPAASEDAGATIGSGGGNAPDAGAASGSNPCAP